MPQRVVDDLEAVQIQEKYCKPGYAGQRRANRAVHALRQQQPVGQACQHIAVGQFVNAFLRGTLLGQVTQKANALHHIALGITHQHPRQVHSTVAASPQKLGFGAP